MPTSMNDPLKIANDALDKAIETEKRNKRLIESIGPAIVNMLQGSIAGIVKQAIGPVAQSMNETLQRSSAEMRDAVSKINVTINPEISIPEIKAPDVIIPEIKIPKPEKASVSVKLPANTALTKEMRAVKKAVEAIPAAIPMYPPQHRYTYKDPIAAVIVDAKGKPMDLGGGSRALSIMRFMDSDDKPVFVSEANPLPTTASISLSGTVLDVRQVSGFADSVNVVDAFSSTAVSGVFNADNRIRVSVETGGSGLTDSELRASGVPVAQVSGATWSTYVTGAAASTYAEIMNPDGRVKVELPSGSSGLTDSELRATSVPVEQVSGSTWSTYVTGVAASTYSELLNADGRVKVELAAGSKGLTDAELRAATLEVMQVSGARWSTEATQSGTWNIGTVTTVTGITNAIEAKQVSGFVDSVYVTGAAASTYAELLNPDGRVKVELPTGSSGLTDAELRAAALEVMQVSGARWSTEATQSGTWNIGTVTTLTGVTNAIESKQVSGFTDSVFITGQADSMMTYQARTTNPTAVSDGADVRPKADDLGRALITPVQVRDLRVTAYATLNTNSETTLLAGASSTFHDLVWIKFANTSSGAVTIDIRETTGGTIIDTYEVPANATQGVASPIPIPQANVGGSWTVDYNDSDISNTTVYVSGLFEKEV